MKYAVAGAIVSVALLGAASVAVAQGRDKHPGGNAGPSHSAPAARSAPRRAAAAAPRRAAPAMRHQAQSSQPRIRQSRSSHERVHPERQIRQRQAAPRRQAPKSVQKSEERSRQRAEQQKHQRTQRAEQQRQRAEQQRQAEQRRQDQRKSKTTQGPKPDMSKGKDGIRQDVKRVQASDEQRVRVRDRLFKERSADRKRWDRERIHDRDVKPIVGFHIPRRHHLHRLPLWVVDYAPIYRSYSYVVVEDTICIVDPATYVIVDVLPASSQRADVRELSLTPEQMRFVYGEVPKDMPVDVRIQLALGAEIPRNVPLYTFPDHVLDRIPSLANYRYVVVGDDVAIVDPADYAVVLVISA